MLVDNLTKNALIFDMKKINEIPLKLVAMCEQTLVTRKSLIDWFDNLKNNEKVIFLHIKLLLMNQ